MNGVAQENRGGYRHRIDVGLIRGLDELTVPIGCCGGACVGVDDSMVVGGSRTTRRLVVLSGGVPNWFAGTWKE